jgi:hypothetical protein
MLIDRVVFVLIQRGGQQLPAAWRLWPWLSMNESKAS